MINFTFKPITLFSDKVDIQIIVSAKKDFYTAKLVIKGDMIETKKYDELSEAIEQSELELWYIEQNHLFCAKKSNF